MIGDGKRLMVEGERVPVEGRVPVGAEETITVAYVELRHLIEELPDGYVDDLARTYCKVSRDQAYAQAADRAADLAYERRVSEHDDLVRLPVGAQLADLHALSADAGHPLGGYALDLALAVLASDRLDVADWLLITERWRATGADLPVLPARPRPRARARDQRERPAPAGARDVRRVPSVKAAASAAPVEQQAPVDPVREALLDRGMRARYARSLRRRAGALWVLEFPVFLIASGLAGWFTSWVPLTVGLLLMVAVGVFAVVTQAKAGRV